MQYISIYVYTNICNILLQYITMQYIYYGTYTCTVYVHILIHKYIYIHIYIENKNKKSTEPPSERSGTQCRRRDRILPPPQSVRGEKLCASQCWGQPCFFFATFFSFYFSPPALARAKNTGLTEHVLVL